MTKDKDDIKNLVNGMTISPRPELSISILFIVLEKTGSNAIKLSIETLRRFQE